MAYRQAKTEAEFKAAQPKTRLYPDEERALFNWAMQNRTWVSLANGKGNDKLNKIKIPPNKIKDVMKVAAYLAPSMNIEEGNGSSEKRGMATAIETAMQENATMLYIMLNFNKNRKPTDTELKKVYPAIDDVWEKSFETTTKVLKEYLTSAVTQGMMKSKSGWDGSKKGM